MGNRFNFIKNLFMKKLITCSVFFIILFCGLSASAQWGRHSGRYNSGYYNRYYRYDRYPSHTSISIIARLPFGAISLGFGGRYYHYYNGIYYRPYDRGYMIVPPPVGIIVPSLPPGYSHVIIGGGSYYRYDDTYYIPYHNGYKVIEEPKDKEESTANNTDINKDTNSEYEKVVLEGKTYYKKGDKYYKATVNKNGEIVYEEIGEKTKSE